MYDTNCPGISQSVAFYENPKISDNEVCSIYGIEFDPFNSFRFMANDKKKTIKFYDLRWPFSSMMLDVGNVVGSDIIEAHYSGEKKGIISVLGTNRANVSLWEVDQNREKNDFSAQGPSSKRIINSKAIDSQIDRKDNVGVQLYSFCDFSNEENSIVESFSYYPNSFNLRQESLKNSEKSIDHSPRMIACLSNCVIKSSRYPKYQVSSISSINGISCARDNLYNSNSQSYECLFNAKPPNSDEALAKDKVKHIEQFFDTLNLESIFPKDVSILMYNRAKKDYGFNFDSNMNQFEKHSPLWNTWKWLRDSHSIKRSKILKINDQTDLSYPGIYSIITLNKEFFPKLEENYSKYIESQSVNFSSKGVSSLPESRNVSFFSFNKDITPFKQVASKSNSASMVNMSDAISSNNSSENLAHLSSTLPNQSSSISILRKISLLLSGYYFTNSSLHLFLNM
ncbi:hypothetical protein AYI68_g3086 [Smittium mucronatum]|uniref:MIOS-like alpha-solenoid domain-containing protein n=1 Tax=Smittium mucronatum TaxID=133383 RepID=A0A1R0H0X5_9FUNG|nr:hypothetical protein AYI68_g3086 [Smittium mucronatum]